MSLREVLRKAAGLLVELPPDEETGGGGDPGAAGDAGAGKPGVPDAGKAGDSIAAKTGGTGAGGESIDVIFDRMNRANQAREGPSPQVKTVGEIARDTAGPNLEDVKIPGPVPDAVAPDGAVDLQAVYRGAELPEAPFSAEQLLEIIATLPAELPLETKRQTVRVTLNAMGKTIGATPETVVADASRKLAALAVFVEKVGDETDRLAAQTEQEIAQLSARIEEQRQAMDAAREKRAKVEQACEGESKRLHDALEFLSTSQPSTGS